MEEVGELVYDKASNESIVYETKDIYFLDKRKRRRDRISKCLQLYYLLIK
uniref:Uncharacterized protein n=1 Tax=Physcomitrium patens TaxID=3218 RepID=A0A2K1JL37_PHYPA|nr:hypothetical protein PHYPA_017066 [Physcomitrium patens]